MLLCQINTKTHLWGTTAASNVFKNIHKSSFLSNLQTKAINLVDLFKPIKIDYSNQTGMSSALVIKWTYSHVCLKCLCTQTVCFTFPTCVWLAHPLDQPWSRNLRGAGTRVNRDDLFLGNVAPHRHIFRHSHTLTLELRGDSSMKPVLQSCFSHAPPPFPSFSSSALFRSSSSYDMFSFHICRPSSVRKGWRTVTSSF